MEEAPHFLLQSARGLPSPRAARATYHNRHCEEQRDEAIQSFFATLDFFASLAMTG